MLRTLAVLVGALVALTAVSARAQDVVLSQLYGNGVHAYFTGDYVKAYDQLSSVVTAGSRDPRVYYFRGLAYLKLGRSPEATQDFKKGAELENSDFGRSFNVARSLERVQGSARQQLETYRVEARLAANEEADKIRKVRFEALQREEERVLRRQAAQAAEAPVEPAPKAEVTPAEKAVETDPFGNPAEPTKPAKADVAQPAEKPAEEEKPADVAKPVEAEKPVEVEKPAAVEKSGTEAQPPAEATPAEPSVTPKPAAGKKSIFGALGKAIGKATTGGSAKGVAPAPEGKVPPPPSPAPASGDPFGSNAEEQPAPPKKAGEEKPATGEKPAEDPFGGDATGEQPAPPKKSGEPGEAKDKTVPPEPAAPEKPAEADPFGGP